MKKRAVMHHLLGQKFERHIAFQLLIARQPDNSHPAASENLSQGVAAEDFLATRVFAGGYLWSEPGTLVSHAGQRK